MLSTQHVRAAYYVHTHTLFAARKTWSDVLAGKSDAHLLANLSSLTKEPGGLASHLGCVALVNSIPRSISPPFFIEPPRLSSYPPAYYGDAPSFSPRVPSSASGRISSFSQAADKSHSAQDRYFCSLRARIYLSFHEYIASWVCAFINLLFPPSLISLP